MNPCAEVKTDYADVQTSSGTTRGCAQLQVRFKDHYIWGKVVFQLIPPRNDSLHQQGAAKRHLCVSESGGSPEHFLWRQSLRRTRSNQW